MFKEIINSSFKELKSFLKKDFHTLSAEEKEIFLKLLENDTRKNVKAEVLKINRLREAEIKELERQKLLWKYEHHYYEKGYSIIAGTDEVGRGPIAGPVVAASVILPLNIRIDGINDSKKLSEKKRVYLNEYIKENAIAYQITEFDSEYIDKINILNASKRAMAKSVASLSVLPELILIDGNQSIPIDLPQISIVKGDSLSFSIAAASILAKVYRDSLMIEYDKRYPEYDFKNNKGYGTEVHYKALDKYGLTPWHRKSFSLEKYEVRND